MRSRVTLFHVFVLPEFRRTFQDSETTNHQADQMSEAVYEPSSFIFSTSVSNYLP